MAAPARTFDTDPRADQLALRDGTIRREIAAVALTGLLGLAAYLEATLTATQRSGHPLYVQAWLAFWSLLCAWRLGVNIRGVRRCRRAPQALAGARGVRTRVTFIRRDLNGSGVARVNFGPASCGEWVRVIEPSRRPLVAGTTGMLYRNSRTIAFVTDAGTYWGP